MGPEIFVGPPSQATRVSVVTYPYVESLTIYDVSGQVIGTETSRSIEHYIIEDLPPFGPSDNDVVRMRLDAGASSAICKPQHGPCQPFLPNRPVFPQFTPDGAYLFAITDAGRGYRWDMRPSSWAPYACAVAGRALTRTEWEAALPGCHYAPACTL